MVTRSFWDQEVHVRRQEVHGLPVELSAAETWETSSPDWFISECLPLGLRPGFAVDLGVEMKKGDAGWHQELMSVLEPPFASTTFLHLFPERRRRQDTLVAEQECDPLFLWASARAHADRLRRRRVFL